MGLMTKGERRGGTTGVGRTMVVVLRELAGMERQDCQALRSVDLRTGVKLHVILKRAAST